MGYRDKLPPKPLVQFYAAAPVHILSAVDTIEVVIPPPKNAVISPQSAHDPSVRDRHIAEIRRYGRMAWQVATGYNQRSRVETQIGRWKSVIGTKLKALSFPMQITEIKLGQKVLNTMTELGRPMFERIS